MEKLVYFSLALYFGLILHFVGDYLTQNHWLATNKTKRFLPAFIHVLLYSLPFLLIVPSMAWCIVSVTHFFIDRYRLAVWHTKFVNNEFEEAMGCPKDTPPFLSFWLTIIIDNTYHVLFNTLAITLHYFVI